MYVDVFGYKQWADLRTLDAAFLLDGRLHLAERAFVLQQLNHMIIVEENFRARLSHTSEPHSSNNTLLVPDLDTLKSRIVESDEWYLAYAHDLSPQQGDEIIPFRFTDGKCGRMSRKEVLFHIVNHGTYHRGEIGRALDQAGGFRPADSFTMYLHAVQPERRYDLDATQSA